MSQAHRHHQRSHNKSEKLIQTAYFGSIRTVDLPQAEAALTQAVIQLVARCRRNQSELA